MFISILNFFATPVHSDGETTYGLTVAGYAAIILVILALLIAAAAFFGKKAGQKKSSGFCTKQLVVCSMAVALSVVTSFIKFFDLPTGGSITLCSMLFICLIGYWYGPAVSLFTGFAYGLLQLVTGPYILYPLQVLVDYPLAFGALGLSGFFWKSKHGLVKGYIAGVLGRYVFAVLSGWLFFGAYAWEGWDPLPYSLAYNASYIFAEAALTIGILLLPPVRKAMDYVKSIV